MNRFPSFIQLKRSALPLFTSTGRRLVRLPPPYIHTNSIPLILFGITHISLWLSRACMCVVHQQSPHHHTTTNNFTALKTLMCFLFSCWLCPTVCAVLCEDHQHSRAPCCKNTTRIGEIKTGLNQWIKCCFDVISGTLVPSVNVDDGFKWWEKNLFYNSSSSSYSSSTEAAAATVTNATSDSCPGT